MARVNSFDGAAKKLQSTVNNTRLDALNRAVGALPGGAGAAANGMLGLASRIKEVRDQSKAAAAEVVALQAAINAKKIQLGAKGGIGGESLKRDIAAMESALASSGSSGAGMAAGLGLAAGATVALGAAAVAVAVPMVKFTNEVDRNRQQLTLFTKDLKVTNEIIGSLQKTADATSLGLPGLLEATKVMSAYGIEARNAGAATKMLGDLALGDNEKLQRFAVNFAQIASLGRAYTVDLKQFGMAGIPIFDALSKVTGKSTAEIMKMAEEGKVTYPLVVKALQELTKEGASFYDGAARGGTDLDRSLNQLTGSWEKLSQIVGTALSPALVSVINGIKDALDGLLSAIEGIGAATKAVAEGPVGKFVSSWLNGLKQIVDFIKENPALAAVIPGVGGAISGALGLQKFGRDAGKEKPGSKKDDAAERAKLAADAQAKAQRDAQDQLAKLRKSEAEKLAKIELDKSRSLADARLGYEQQLSDFRVSQLQKIADMERTLLDERRAAEFKLAQTQADVASGRRVGDLSSQILSGKAAGKDTTQLEGARAAEELMNKSARQRAEIQFSSTTRTIELERRLTDFKREAQRALGQMQLGYTRQVDDILRKSGIALSDEMVKGAKAAKEILESVQMPTPDGGSGGSGGGGSVSVATGAFAPLSKLIGGHESYGGNYGAFNRGGSNNGHTAHGSGIDPNLTNMTLAEIQRRQLAPGVPKNQQLHAVGKYQIIGGTLRGLLNGSYGNTGVKSTDKFTPEIQERLGAALAQNRIVPGNVNASMRGLRSEWIGLQYAPDKQLRAAVEAMMSGRGGAANNIVPTAPRLPAPTGAMPSAAGIPTTSPGLEAANDSLKRLEADQKRLDLLRQEQELTQGLSDKLTTIIGDRNAELKSAQDRNRLEQQTLELMRGGVSPELAKQLATNQQFVENSTKQLESQRATLEAAVKEKDITEETRKERQKLLDLLNSQIGAQPQLLSGLNQEAQQTQALTDQRAAMDQAKSDAQGISSTITGGLKDAIKAAITGGDVKAALSNMLGSLGDRLLDMAFRPLEQMLTQGLTNMLTPAANQQVQAAFIMQTASTQMITAANTYAAAMAAGAAGGGGGFSPLSLIGPLLGVAGAGFGGGAFGAGFNPLSTGNLFPGGIFEGGGYTGNAPRAGGLDGKGGFPALLHPNETVVDHRSSAARSALNGGGSGGGAPSLTLNVTATQIADDRWVKVDDLDAAMSKAARQGAAMGERRTLDRLRQSPKTRKAIGI